ncbi:flagellar basal body rod protein FlgB [Buchnera aphidicola (Muscaphis stroyani)]|uniref:Flagellar basal body rod protein FlgB n=1 Tax=Buchnera aphidicola (Muscaphis stroyani) TaxID=1241869 RepID=A0A4D6Y7L5_9GAMM|nr:flagellar basal body rod protein FlgB [Buchnera aphidicola]QCI24403.1 flagellar basal body rod protein FlgB [Buchnera aphidicola (Muscaphis stroyani)]
MFEKINKSFDFNQNVLNLYSKRQEILTSNIANSDTPGYKAMDISFKNEFNKIINKNNMRNKEIFLTKTSPYHLDLHKNVLSSIKIIPVKSNEIKKNKNTVDMNRERIQFIQNSLKYQSSLAFIKNEIKNIMHVLQG